MEELFEEGDFIVEGSELSMREFVYIGHADIIDDEECTLVVDFGVELVE